MGQGDVLIEGRHPTLDLTPGQTQQQTVAGKGRQLGIGGHIRVTVHKIVTKQAVGTVIFLDLPPAAAVHGIAHGVAHGQTQQASTV